jgi:hypothetical protein
VPHPISALQTYPQLAYDKAKRDDKARKRRESKARNRAQLREAKGKHTILPGGFLGAPATPLPGQPPASYPSSYQQFMLQRAQAQQRQAQPPPGERDEDVVAEDDDEEVMGVSVRVCVLCA